MHTSTETRLVYGLAGFTISLGIILILTADRFLQAPTFAGTFQWARPEIWGALFAVTAALLALEFRSGAGRLPALVLSILYSAFAVTAAFNPFGGSGVFSATVVYLGFAWFSATCILACGRPAER